MKVNEINNSFVIVKNIVCYLLVIVLCYWLISKCIGSPFGPHFHKKGRQQKTEKKIRLQKLEYLCE